MTSFILAQCLCVSVGQCNRGRFNTDGADFGDITVLPFQTTLSHIMNNRHQPKRHSPARHGVNTQIKTEYKRL